VVFNEAAPCQHFLPEGMTSADLVPAEVSIVVPALNEEITIGEFVEWCKEGLARTHTNGQILIVDSSTDHTAEIALAHGAEVLKTPKLGLGRAYLDSIPYIRGKYVILGDADLTYDFRELSPFVEKLRQGYEYVMGSRFRGSLPRDAMPALHRYFGNPATTWILNRIYGTRFSDIHCGMRGLTTDAFRRIDLRSQSWQYASEMIIKAVHLRLKTAEVPVTFHKDREGRQSHLKRLGWRAPWQAGWISLQTMLVFGADFFLIRPGLALFLLGSIGVGALSGGPVEFLGIGFSLHWDLLFLLFAVMGVQLLIVGVLARAIYGVKDRKWNRWRRVFDFNTAVLLSLGLFLMGVLSFLPLVRQYVQFGFALPMELSPASYHAVAGLGLMLLSFIHFAFSLVYSAVSHAMEPVKLPQATAPQATAAARRY